MLVFLFSVFSLFLSCLLTLLVNFVFRPHCYINYCYLVEQLSVATSDVCQTNVLSGSLGTCDSFLNVFQNKGLRREVICPYASSVEATSVSIRRSVSCSVISVVGFLF